MRLFYSAVAATVLLAAFPATAQQDHGHDGHMMQQNPDASSSGEMSYEQKLKAAMDTMHADMNMQSSGDPDHDFAQGMIPHHQGAIDMSRIVLEYGKDPELRRLANNIIKAQEEEIAFLKSWLEKHPAE